MTICLLLSFIGWFGSKTLTEINHWLNTQDEPAIEKLELIIQKHNDDPIKQSKYSKQIAQIKYRSKGIITTYLLPTGEIEKYEPTEEDIEFIKVKSDHQLRMRQAIKGLKANNTYGH